MRQLNRSVWPHQIKLRDKINVDVCNWCTQNIGKQMHEWIWFAQNNIPIFAFKTEADYIMFKLRWE